jgi:hypothetical protein
MWPPKKNAAFTLCFTLYKNDGTVIANPGTLTRAVSVDLGAVDTTPVNAVTEEDTTYGQLSWVLDAAEMNGDVIWVYCVDDTEGCVPFTCTLYTTANTQDEIGTKIDTVDDYLDTELAAITAAVITNAAGTDIAADIIAVKGVVDDILTDTGTTIPGTISTMQGNVTDILTDTGTTLDGKADQIIAAVITNATGVDIAADIIAVKAETAAILVDTGTTLDGKADQLVAAVITNAAGADVAADIIAIKAETALIVEDTGELQTNQGAWATATGFSTHSAADVANLILVTPAQKIVTNAAGEVDANIQSINDAALTGNGTVGTPWGPA